MKNRLYRGFSGIDRTEGPIVGPQISLLRSKNFIMPDERGVLRKRGGTTKATLLGDCWGIGGYQADPTSVGIPGVVYFIAYHNNGGTAYVSKSIAGASWSALSLGAYTSFGTAPMSFAQIANLFAIFGGRPAKITDISSGGVSRLGGGGPTAAPTVAASTGAGSLTGEYSWKYTFYDSTSGWESSPSPANTTLSLSAKNGEISGMSTTVDREGIDKKRIYRTQLTGEAPWYHVADVTLATTTYTDSTSDASLGAVAPTEGDHDAPPSSTYIGESHEKRFWIADGTSLYYSKIYDGSLYNLEYFSADRKLVFNQQITAVKSAPRLGGLLVFKAPGYGIDLVRGRSSEDFEIVEYYPSRGTYHQQSVVVQDDMLFFFDKTRPILLKNGQISPTFSDKVYPIISELCKDIPSDVPYVWALWDNLREQFLLGISSISASSVQWQDATSWGVGVSWKDSFTTVTWQV